MQKEVYEFHPSLFALITASFPLPHRMPGYVRRNVGSRISHYGRGLLSAFISLLLVVFLVANPFYNKYYIENPILYWVFLLIVYMVVYFIVAAFIFTPIRHDVKYRIDKKGIYFYRKKFKKFDKLSLMKKDMKEDYYDTIDYRNISNLRVKLSFFGEVFNYARLNLEPKLPPDVVSMHNYSIADFCIYGIPKETLHHIRFFIKDHIPGLG